MPKPQRSGAPSLGKRYAADIARQIAPIIDAVLAGRPMPPISLRFESKVRKGDVLAVSVAVTK